MLTIIGLVISAGGLIVSIIVLVSANAQVKHFENNCIATLKARADGVDEKLKNGSERFAHMEDSMERIRKEIEEIKITLARLGG